MKPTEPRPARAGLAVAEEQTPWGWVRVWASEQGVVAVEGPRTRRAAERPGEPSGSVAAGEMARQALKEITEYLGGERREFATPVDWRGWPAFTRQVLETCARVPYGTTVSYGELARRVGSPRAARAVGQALGRNPVPLIVPCHRVVRADGGLGGFGGGPALKGRLLELEKPSKGLGPGGWPEQGK